jgi:orotidine-5'-phosphate decarboxylase
MLARHEMAKTALRAVDSIPLRERLIVALDVPTVERARAIVDKLGDAVVFYKVGLQLQYARGLQFAEELIKNYKKKVFLDSKLFDIGTTIRGAVENIERMGVTFLTVHGTSNNIVSAVRARRGTDLKILIVTVLTTLDAIDLKDLYGDIPVILEDLVKYRTRKALEAGADGVISSGQEAKMIRNIAGSALTIVAPGIRPDGSEVNDQKRITTPREAIAAGADYLVVGRPILQASDPLKVANKIIAEIGSALEERRAA